MSRFVLIYFSIVATTKALELKHLPVRIAVSSISSYSDDRFAPNNLERIRRAQDSRKGYRYEVQFPSSPGNPLILQNQKLVTQNGNPVRLKNISDNKNQNSKDGLLTKLTLQRGDSFNPSSDQNYLNELKLLKEFLNFPVMLQNNNNRGKANMITPIPLAGSSRSDSQSNFSPNYSSNRYRPTQFQNNKLTQYQNTQNGLKLPVFHNQETFKPSFEENKNEVKNLNFEIKPTYLPPKNEPADSPEFIPRENDGYMYEKPSNQLTLPNEQSYECKCQNNTNNEDDDTVEILNPNIDKKDQSMNENANSFSGVSRENVSKHDARLHFTKQGEHFTNDQGNVYNNPLKKMVLPSEHLISLIYPNIQNLKQEFDKDNDPLEKLSQSSSEKFWTSANLIPKSTSESLSPTKGHNEKLHPESETSLSVKYAGSVFNEEGLPHLSPEMVLPVDYSFSYQLRGWPHLGHEETRGETGTTGSYWVGLPDGRVQTVEYTAGPGGFVPRVSYRSSHLAST